jgi:diaminopropionate ammonia-lyase
LFKQLCEYENSLDKEFFMTANTGKIEWATNECNYTQLDACNKYSPMVAREARRFHRQIPGFRMSPLVALPNLAHLFKVSGLWVKNESVRLQLNSFKVLGGAYAIYKFLLKRLGKEFEKLSYEELISPATKNILGKITFVTATDGNHGRGVAWAAEKLGHESIVYVHKETSQPRIEAIRSYGATVIIVEGNYDDAVRLAAIEAEKNDWVVISDTSWENYTEIPTWIMQGYTTMMAEAQEQFSGQGLTKPTHLFIQAGVGALAASVIGYYHSLFGKNSPKCIVVEPENANCLYRSIKNGDGKPHSIDGNLSTIMAGLACGEPSPIAWNILKNFSSAFISCPDFIAAKGMRIYATPLRGDPFVLSGESGGVTLGAFVTVMCEPSLEPLKEFLQIDENSEILFVNTEGNTDPVQFRQIIWEGSNPVPRNYWSKI